MNGTESKAEQTRGLRIKIADFRSYAIALDFIVVELLTKATLNKEVENLCLHFDSHMDLLQLKIDIFTLQVTIRLASMLGIAFGILASSIGVLAFLLRSCS
jgi:hypothetical protein